MKRPAKIAAGVFAGVVLFLAWYCIATNYDYGMLSGNYTFHGNGVSASLVLRSDRSFHQEVFAAGRRKVADGNWRRVGEGGVSFSTEFLRLPGAKTFTEEFGMSYGNEEDSEFCGHFKKILGVYPILTLNANPPGPTLCWTGLR